MDVDVGEEITDPEAVTETNYSSTSALIDTADQAPPELASNYLNTLFLSSFLRCWPIIVSSWCCN